MRPPLEPHLPLKDLAQTDLRKNWRKPGFCAKGAFKSPNPWFLLLKNTIFRQGETPWTPLRELTFLFLLKYRISQWCAPIVICKKRMILRFDPGRSHMAPILPKMERGASGSYTRARGERSGGGQRRRRRRRWVASFWLFAAAGGGGGGSCRRLRRAAKTGRRAAGGGRRAAGGGNGGGGRRR